MSVTKIRYGTPEKLVPSKFAPAPKCSIEEASPEKFENISFSVSNRGVKLVMPINSAAGVYGFGLQLKGVQHRGRKLHIRPNADPKSYSGDSHAPVPFFVTTDGYGIYVDTARYATFYCGNVPKPKSEDEVQVNKNKLTSDFDELYAVRKDVKNMMMTIEIPNVKGVDIYYIKGNNVLDVVSQYNMLSGGGCQPSMWGLGNFYRCEVRFNDQQVLEMARKFRELNIPCDVLGLEPGWQTTSYSCSFIWNNERFPNPKETISRLDDMGFKVNLWQHAFTNPQSPIYKDLLPLSGDYLVWNGLVPDFSLEETRKIFKDYNKKVQIDAGVSGFKLDECDGSDFTGSWTFPNCTELPSGLDGEQYHNLFGTLYAQTMLETLGENKTVSEVRNLGALAASYPFVLYSDLYDHKDFITGVVNSGFSGILWSPEVRHATGTEDLLRRIQTVVFSAHSLINAFYLNEMPWIAMNYSNVYKPNDNEGYYNCTDEVRRLLNIRMSLIPYLYNAFYDYYKTGKPPVRALVCDYEGEEESWDIDDQYLLGDSIIVAPIVAPNKSRELWLPKGEWYNFFTGEKLCGGRHTIETEDIPVFVKGGTLLPLAKPVQYVDKDTVFEIELSAYGDCSSSTCTLVEDDGVTYNSRVKVISVTEKDFNFHSCRYNITGIKKY